MSALKIPGKFTPQQLSRRGEWMAWGLTIVVSVYYFGMPILGGIVLPGMLILWVFFAIAALMISLGNWMDRQTEILLSESGIEFHNGLRHENLTWPEVEKVTVRPARWGRQVQVLAADSHFEFRTFGEVKVQGNLKGTVGFREGEAILTHILREANLQLTREDKQGYYYSRG